MSEKKISGRRLQEKIPTYAPIVQKTAPAVVEIYAFLITENRLINPYVNDPAYEMFFRFFNQYSLPQRQVHQSSGSGVIISETGIIATCAHVVKGSNSIKIRLNNGREYKADIIVIEEKEDLALLRIHHDGSEKFPFIKIGDIDQYQVGDFVLAIGNAFGLGQTVTSGIISAPLRSLINDRVVIQTDASVNPGNSGGALISLDGKLIGIPNAIISKSGAFHGVGFCRPAVIVKSMTQRHLKHVERGWFGIYVQNLTNGIIQAMDDSPMQTPQGVIVTEIHPKSPAKTAGLLQGDIITKINDRTIHNIDNFLYRQQLAESEQKITMLVWRKGQVLPIAFKAIAPPKSDGDTRFKITGFNPLNGYVVAYASPALTLDLGLDDRLEGVIVVDTPQGILRSPIQVGDVLQQMNNTKIHKVQDVIDATQAKSHRWLIVLKRGQERIVLQTN